MSFDVLLMLCEKPCMGKGWFLTCFVCFLARGEVLSSWCVMYIQSVSSDE